MDPLPSRLKTSGLGLLHRCAINRVIEYNESMTDITIYTDGSQYTDRNTGTRHTGAGAVIYRQGHTICELSRATGPCAVAYDAEMEAMAMASESARDLILAMPDKETIKHVRFFCDNTGTIWRIFSAIPGKAHACSRRFRNATLQILDELPNVNIHVEWTPGHHGIKGNERADALAKLGGSLEPAYPGYKSLAYVGARTKEAALQRWQHKWACGKRHRNFIHADHFPPSFRPRDHFYTLSRKTFSRVTQCRTGHAHIGEYYARFVPTEDRACPCGVASQTREHVLRQCPLYADHRHLLGISPGDRSMSNLLGTDKGIIRLAKFIEATGAFAKLPAHMT